MMNKYLELYLKAYTSKVAFDFTKKKMKIKSCIR